MAMSSSQNFTRTALAIFAFLIPAALFAQSGTTVTGKATLMVEQTGPQEGVAGEWSLLKPDFKRVNMGQKMAHTFLDAAAGNYTIITTTPSGASTSMKLWLNDQLLKSVELPQKHGTPGSHIYDKGSQCTYILRCFPHGIYGCSHWTIHHVLRSHRRLHYPETEVR
ncbi:MAG: hypothetical protein Greene041662_1074 [Candidatus Peregrinibacteria bacterium Greene0416_62]|nr:MAG: hypothetical protein Greene041662_1074 [Candidatus Peregrinibacteria bacterium Greene0416_62]